MQPLAGVDRRISWIATLSDAPASKPHRSVALLVMDTAEKGEQNTACELMMRDGMRSPVQRKGHLAEAKCPLVRARL